MSTKPKPRLNVSISFIFFYNSFSLEYFCWQLNTYLHSGLAKVNSSAKNRAGVKGGLGFPLWSLGPPTSNNPYHQYTT